MKKQLITFIAIILISINVNAQLTEKLLPKSRNLAYFDSLSVYKNLYPVKRVNGKIFITQIKDSIYINDLKLIVQNQKKSLYDVEDCYEISYECIDDDKNRYNLTIQFAYNHSYEACLIVENTDIRYGFAHTF